MPVNLTSNIIGSPVLNCIIIHSPLFIASLYHSQPCFQIPAPEAVEFFMKFLHNCQGSIIQSGRVDHSMVVQQ